MGVVEGLLVGSLLMSGVSMVQQQKQAKKSAAAQRRAEEYQMKQDALKQARERRQQIREARIRQGQVEQATAIQGAASSSAAVGGAGSIQSQLSSNLGFLDQSGKIAGKVGAYTSAANQYAYNAQQWGAVGQFAGNIFSAAGGFSALSGPLGDTGLTQQYSGGIAIPTRRPV